MSNLFAHQPTIFSLSLQVCPSCQLLAYNVVDLSTLQQHFLKNDRFQYGTHESQDLIHKKNVGKLGFMDGSSTNSKVV
jgi:hypothetical protein